MSSHKQIFKNLRKAFKFFDLYGQNVNLFIDKKPKFYSTFSGIMSIFIIAIILYTFTGFISSWLNKEKMNLIPSSVSYSVNELMMKNQDYEYLFNYENYYIYWGITANLPNGTIFHTIDLKKYYTYKISYYSENLEDGEIAVEPCKIDHQDVFLGLGEKIINNDLGKIGIQTICIKNNFKMGLFPDRNLSIIKTPGISFSLYQCLNSSENNYSCASQQSIDEMIKYTYVQTTLPTTVFDFNNVKKPQKNIYDYHYTYLDKSMLKLYINSVTTTTLYTDYGLISEDYRLQSTNFNPNINYDPKIRESNDPMFIFNVGVSLNFQIYYLKNLKLNELVGNLGGLVNAIFLLGKLVCITYNSLYLKFRIINATFSHPQSNTSRGEVLPKSFTEIFSKSWKQSRIARSLFSCVYLIPHKELRIFYQKGAKQLHEYLDIRKIIKRMQDIDKLKDILLNPEQRKLFEFIPKPDVYASKNKLSLENKLNLQKQINSGKIPINFKNTLKSMLIEDKDPISKRILECLDQKMISNSKFLKKEGILL